MKILVLTRGNEQQSIQPILSKLKADVTIFTGNFTEHNWWFRRCYYAEEYWWYHHVLTEQSDYYKKRIITDYLNFTFLRHFKKLKPTQKAINFIKKVNPDYVFMTNICYRPFSQDYNYALAAQSLGIPIVGFISRWDVTTNKTVIQIMPDILYCWNDDHERDLIKYHNVPKERIRKVGPWIFEEWIKKHKVTKCNLPKTYNLYLCSSLGVTEEEEIEAFKQVKNPLISPHPDKPVNTSFPIVKEKDLQTKFNMYSHAKNIYTINSSSALEAIFMGKSVIFLPSNPDKTTKALHFKQLQNVTDFRKWAGFQKKLPSDLIAQDFNL